MSQADITMVIPTFNRREPLSILLKQIEGQQLPHLSYKIIVVVDGSTDGTYEMLAQEFPRVIVVKGSGNWWFTKSMNEGCKYAVEQLKAKALLTINDDVQIPPNYLQNLHKHFSEKGESSIIGSASYSLSAPHLISFAGIKSQNRWRLKYYKYLPSFTAKNPNELSGLVPSVVLPTRGMLVSSAIMQKVNYLDEKMFPQYASDYDFVLRAAKAGAKIYVSYDAYLFENMQLTSSGNPRLAKTFKSYLKNVFLNKYSSNYFYNQTNMAWRHGFKFLFPYYFLLTLVAIPYIYMKYKHTALSSQVKNKN